MRKLFILCMLLVLATANAQNAAWQKTITAFDKYIQTAMQLWKTPGLAVVIVKDSKVIFNKGYGVKDIATKAPFTTSTLSICASTTKAMTAVCMGMLVDAGKVKWTDKVSDIYPGLKLYDNYANSELTVKDLFTHNTGLGNADLLWMFDYSMDTIIHQMRYIQPAYSFRSSFIYQNLMYMVAGEVIHKVSGIAWDKFIKDSLFARLGMNNTFPDYRQSLVSSNHITPHYMYEDSVIETIPFIDSKTVDAAGGVWSCTDDINKWMIFMLDSAKVNGKRLLTPETYTELFKPQAMVTASEFYPTAQLTKPHWTTYGLGWFQEDYKGKMVQFHTGSLDGAVAILGMIPDENFGIYIFANMDHTEIRHALMYKAMDLFVFNDDKNDWSKDFYALYTGLAAKRKANDDSTDAKRVLNTKPSLELKNYAGNYHNEIYGDAAIVMLGDSLIARFPNNVTVNLSHWNYDTFLGKFEHKWYGKDFLRFDLNEEGKVKSFNFWGLVYEKKE
ncbi:serine hydrolase [Parafilimonas sp.]|uniref:serine hydrolase n=1 Tax=Parafilimonas sp. TaxID=1969739 RepID=UPI0039E4616E